MDKDRDTSEAEHPEPSTISTSPEATTTPKNAFQTLMSSPSRTKPSKPHQLTTTTTTQHTSRHPSSKAGLGIYLSNPASFPTTTVLYHTDSFVVIRDKYPKSSVHLLILPRTPKTGFHPFIAFQDEELLASTRAEAAKVRGMVAEELRRMFGRESGAEAGRRGVIEAGDGVNGDVVPQGRDWESEVMVGVHAGPSMSHLHVHVLSRDRVSECMRHGKHYNSFNTGFFVGLEELPLDKGDVRWRKDRGGGLREDLKCWRCGRGFGNGFARLKRHLEEEFEGWKKE